MARAESVLGILGPARVSLGGGSRGHDALTQAMVSSALASCRDREGAALLVALYHNSVDDPLLANLAARAIRIGRLNGWRGYGETRMSTIVTRMIVLAADDMLHPRICRLCNGTAHVYNESAQPVSCPDCDGTGHFPRSEHKTAATLGIGWHDWSATWKQRYRILQAFLDGLVGTAAAELEHALR